MKHKISALVTHLNNHKFDYTARIPYTKDNLEILWLLQSLNYLKILNTVEIREKSNLKEVLVELNILLYNKHYFPFYKTISTPGRPLYLSYRNVKNTKQGRELHLIRSSLGILTH